MNHKLKCKMQNYKTSQKIIAQGKNPDDLGYGNDILAILKGQSMKKIINNLFFTKSKNFCSTKGTVKKTRWQDTGWQKIFAKHISNKGPLSKYTKIPLKQSDANYFFLTFFSRVLQWFYKTLAGRESGFWEMPLRRAGLKSSGREVLYEDQGQKLYI